MRGGLLPDVRFRAGEIVEQLAGRLPLKPQAAGRIPRSLGADLAEDGLFQRASPVEAPIRCPPGERVGQCVRSGGGRRIEIPSRRPTYAYQLDRFCDAVIRGQPTLTGPDDAVANMTVLDAVYRAANMRVRGA